MSDPKGFPSLKAFLDSVNSAKYAEISARAESKVTHEDALGEMQAHILRLYDKTEALHSFTDEGGGVFDCIPIEQQPGLRGQPGLSALGTIPKAPDLPPIEAAGGAQDERKPSLIVSPLGPERKDSHGNARHCPPGTVPIRRVTLEDMARFGTLRDFFRKDPRSGPPTTGQHTARSAGNPPLGSCVSERQQQRRAQFPQPLGSCDWSQSNLLALTTLVCRRQRRESSDRRMWVASLSGTIRKRASAFVHLLDRR